MLKLYFTCLWMQYAVWILYASSLLVLYGLGFLISLLSVRWLLIPATLGVIFISVFLSLIIVSIFCFQKISARGVEMNGRLSFMSALPSIFVLSVTIVYLLAYFR